MTPIDHVRPFLISMILLNSTVGLAEGYSDQVVAPPRTTARPNAEFYSTLPDAKVQLPVNIWGEVREPGIHYVPAGSSLLEALSSAGGPTGYAALPDVQLVRKQDISYVDLLGDGKLKVQAHDTVYVERALKHDLPFVFGGISALVSVATLYFVAKRDR